MAAAAAVPIGTAIEILKHASTAGAASSLTSSLAVLPAATVAPIPVATVPASAPVVAPTVTRVPRITTRTFQGPVISENYGDVQATITVTGRRITDVVISAPMDNPRSSAINSQADPLLHSETLTAQSATVNTVSGATYTSQAYQQSLQAAIVQAQSAKALQ